MKKKQTKSFPKPAKQINIRFSNNWGPYISDEAINKKKEFPKRKASRQSKKDSLFTNHIINEITHTPSQITPSQTTKRQSLNIRITPSYDISDFSRESHVTKEKTLGSNREFINTKPIEKNAIVIYNRIKSGGATERVHKGRVTTPPLIKPKEDKEKQEILIDKFISNSKIANVGPPSVGKTITETDWIYESKEPHKKDIKQLKGSLSIVKSMAMSLPKAITKICLLRELLVNNRRYFMSEDFYKAMHDKLNLVEKIYNEKTTKIEETNK